MMQLPTTDPGGQVLNYKFQHKASGKEISGEQTLADANVQDGDVLRLSYEPTAG